MGREYEQLTLAERHVLFQLREAGTAVGEMADRLGRHRSTIYRELERNRKADGSYLPETAQRFAWARRLRGSKIERRSQLGLRINACNASLMPIASPKPHWCESASKFDPSPSTHRVSTC